MGDWGAKVSIKGIPVETAADHQLLFSSSWPLLKIHAQGSVTITNNKNDQVLYTHGLGYPPVFWVFTVDATKSIAFLRSASIMVSDTNLKFFGNAGDSGASETIYYYIFTQDMTKEFTADALKTTDSDSNVGDDYGFKISKEGKDVRSTDGRDFVINSSYRSLQIHKTKYGEHEAGWTETVTHDLGYIPFYSVYFNLTGYAPTASYWWLLTSGEQEYGTHATTTKVETSGVGVGNVFTIIYKDPWELI